MLAVRSMLGLAVSERSIAVAEVAASRGRIECLRAGEFVLPGGLEVADPADLGRNLRLFLREQRFSASHCMIGLEAGWLIAKEKTLPPSASADLRSILCIAAERDFASTAEDFAFDYVVPAGSSGRTVLLVAASRRRLDGAAALAHAAGLVVSGIGCSALALAAATRVSAAPERVVLYLRWDRTELTVQSRGGFRVLRRLAPPTPAAPEQLAREVCQVIALLPAEKDSTDQREVLVWDEFGLDMPSLNLLRERLALPVAVCRFPDDCGLTVGRDGRALGLAPRAAQAAALAADGLARQGPVVDFLHSRLAPPRKPGLRRRLRWVIAAAALMGAAATYFAIDGRLTQREVSARRAELEGLRDGIQDARNVVENVTFARGWYDRRPQFLACLRAVTGAFPEQARVWATSLTVRDDHKVLLTAKCEDERTALEVLDRLKTAPGLSDVKPLYLRQAGTNTHEVSFAVTFDYTGVP